ncbi:MAG: ATP-binding cassette domain-containing protein [Chloroflexi bacterium]|nr:ATP-binding cassette domain-containing protein [Chloroflexota bacterium]
MTQPLPLVVENLSFKYRSRTEPALKDVSLELHAGELLLVAGVSGSGKTTLIRLINGLIPRSYKGDVAGQVMLNGQNSSAFTLAKLSQIVGTLLQDPERQILGAHVKSEVAFGP